MFELLLSFIVLVLIVLFLSTIWRINARKYISSGTVASAYDAWTQDKLLERLWGEHIHLGFYPSGKKNIDFRKAKVQFCLLYTSPSPRDSTLSRMPSSA